MQQPKLSPTSTAPLDEVENDLNIDSSASTHTAAAATRDTVKVTTGPEAGEADETDQNHVQDPDMREALNSLNRLITGQ